MEKVKNSFISLNFYSTSVKQSLTYVVLSDAMIGYVIQIMSPGKTNCSESKTLPTKSDLIKEHLERELNKARLSKFYLL